MAERGELPSARKLALPTLFLVACFAALIWRRPPPQPLMTELSGPIFGTTFTVKVMGETEGVEALLKRELEQVDASMSTWREDSELNRVNRGELERVSPELAAVLALAQQVWTASEQTFDPTVGPLVDAWGFGPDGRDVVAPSEDRLSELRAVVGFERVRLEGERVQLMEGTRLDLSAIAKGYAVDQVAEALLAVGHADFMVEIGGEIRTAGQKAGQSWTLAVESPQGGIHTTVPLSGLSMATSGDYRNWIQDAAGTRTHTIDPRTGRPVDHPLASVTVLHPSCALADAWATALSVLGPEEGLAVAEREELAVLMLVRSDAGFDELATAGFEAHRVREP